MTYNYITILDKNFKKKSWVEVMLGVPELWSDKQTDKQRLQLYVYRYNSRFKIGYWRGPKGQVHNCSSNDFIFLTKGKWLEYAKLCIVGKKRKTFTDKYKGI